jgi:hypothetical protein
MIKKEIKQQGARDMCVFWVSCHKERKCQTYFIVKFGLCKFTCQLHNNTSARENTTTPAQERIQSQEGTSQGKARQGKARQGKARQGKARQGKARQGKARQGKRENATTMQ